MVRASSLPPASSWSQAATYQVLVRKATPVLLSRSYFKKAARRDKLPSRNRLFRIPNNGLERRRCLLLRAGAWRLYRGGQGPGARSEEQTSELQSHSFIPYALFCLK